MASRPLIKEALRLLNVCGINLHKETMFSNLRKYLTVATICIVSLDSLVVCLLKWRGLNSMEDLTVGIGIYQILMKILVIIYHRKQILEVLNAMDQFWPVNKYGKELQNEIEGFQAIFRKSVKFLMVAISITASLYIVQAFYGSTRKLPFRSYLITDSNKSLEFELMFSLHIIVVPIACMAFIACDFLFISLVVNITCELKLVSKGFENIPINPKINGDNNESLNELIKVIDHHDLTLKSIKTLNEIYSMLLLNIFFFNMICMCLELLSIIVSSDFQGITKYGLYVICYINQLFFYCIAGSFLTTESGNISFAIYNTNWWIKTQPKLRMAYVMVIRRANKAEKLTAGGMFNLDLDSFARVTKTALSFFTVVKAMYKNK